MPIPFRLSDVEAAIVGLGQRSTEIVREVLPDEAESLVHRATQAGLGGTTCSPPR